MRSTKRGGKFIFLIYKGNNSELLREALLRRQKWVEGPYDRPAAFNFLWKPTSSGIQYELFKSTNRPQFINHIENNKEIAEKVNLFKNISEK